MSHLIGQGAMLIVLDPVQGKIIYLAPVLATRPLQGARGRVVFRVHAWIRNHIAIFPKKGVF